MIRIDGPDDITAALLRLRAATGLSQRKFAALAGVSQGTVTKGECGSVRPNVDTLTRLTAAAGYAVLLVQTGSADATWLEIEEDLAVMAAARRNGFRIRLVPASDQDQLP